MVISHFPNSQSQLSSSAPSSPVKNGRMNLEKLRAEIQKPKNPTEDVKSIVNAGVCNMDVSITPSSTKSQFIDGGMQQLNHHLEAGMSRHGVGRPTDSVGCSAHAKINGGGEKPVPEIVIGSKKQQTLKLSSVVFTEDGVDGAKAHRAKLGAAGNSTPAKKESNMKNRGNKVYSSMPLLPDQGSCKLPQSSVEGSIQVSSVLDEFPNDDHGKFLPLNPCDRILRQDVRFAQSVTCDLTPRSTHSLSNGHIAVARSGELSLPARQQLQNLNLKNVEEFPSLPNQVSTTPPIHNP